MVSAFQMTDVFKRLVAAGMSCILVASAFALSGCDTAGSDEPAPPPRALTTQEQALVEASSQDFGLRLFRTVSAEEGAGKNVFVSPLSVSMALGMTLNGAEDSTRAAMKEALAVGGLSQAEINASYRSLIDLLVGLDPKVRFQLANSIWYRQGFSVEPSFLDTNEEYFDAEVTALDFTSPQAIETINGWVKENTEGKIEKILESIDPDHVMFLINAIYFQGDWRYQFDEEKTEEASFTLADGSEATVDMMEMTDFEEPLPYYRGDTFEAVDLPYGDSLYTMTVLVPHREESADSLARTLDAAQWQAITDGLRPARLSSVALPRFTLEYEKSLKEALRAMGMGVAFSEGADFGGISGAGLFVSDVKHKTFLEVDEEGTEAAAATSVGIKVTSAPPSVRADRPFLLVIRENHSGTLLFIGKVADPTAGSGA